MTAAAPLRIGIDTAHWQGVVPWREVAAAGVQFAWLKATHGLSSTPDPQFSRSWSASRGVLPYGRGVYHWLTDGDPVKQAERVVRLLEGTNDLGELHISVDWEEPSTQFRAEALVLHALKCLRRVKLLAGGAVLYTGAWYVTQYVALDREIERVVSRDLVDEICSYPLWHAEYPRIVLAERRACATANLAIPAPRLGKIWRDRGIPEAVHQFDGNGGCLLPNGVDADFNAANATGLVRVRRAGSPVVITAPAPAFEPEITRRDTPRAIAAVREPIADLSVSSPATPLRAGEAEHTVAPDEPEL